MRQFHQVPIPYDFFFVNFPAIIIRPVHIDALVLTMFVNLWRIDLSLALFPFYDCSIM